VIWFPLDAPYQLNLSTQTGFKVYVGLPHTAARLAVMSVIAKVYYVIVRTRLPATLLFWSRYLPRRGAWLPWRLAGTHGRRHGGRIHLTRPQPVPTGFPRLRQRSNRRKKTYGKRSRNDSQS
jgi:hypothetical protein